MKKLNVLLFSLIFALSGVALALPSFVFGSSNAEEEVAAQKINGKDAFLDFFGDAANYSKKIVLGCDIDFEGEAIDTSLAKFTGEFDGGGHVLKNFVITSSNENYGLFSSAQGATIKDLKIEGDIKFDIQETSNQELFLGVLLGRGDDGVKIEQCEIGQSIVSEGRERFSQVETIQNGPISTRTKFTFGGVAGMLKGGSTLSNCITYLQGQFSTTWVATDQAKGPIKVGGLVGLLDNSSVVGNAAFADLALFAQSQNLILFAGGLVGEVQNSEARVINNIFVGSLNAGEDSNADFVAGGVAGTVFSTAPESRRISFNYWSQAGLSVFGQNNSQMQPDKNNIQSEINSTFMRKEEHWHDTSSDWDFSLVWDWNPGSRLHLQKFLTFEFSFADDVNKEILASFKFDNFQDSEGKEYKYGEDVLITIVFNPEIYGYYSFSGLLLDGEPINEKYVIENNFSETILTKDSIDPGQKTGQYVLKLMASASTAGSYSFDFDLIYFNYLIEVSGNELDRGGVRMADSQGQGQQRLNPKNIVKNTRQSIEAVPTGIYSFDQWDFCVWDMTEEDYVVQSQLAANPLTFNFGDEGFGVDEYVDGHPFKLVAHFTDEKALEISFGGYDKNVITEVTFNGQKFENKAIRVSPNATNVELTMTVKEGYELNVEALVDFLSKRYGNANTALLSNYSVIEQEDGSIVYRFPSLNMTSLKNGMNGQSLSIELHARARVVDDERDLTWLWILLGVVGGLAIIGGVLAFFLIRRRRILKKLSGGQTDKTSTQNKVKKSKEKKVDYRDYYG